MAEKAENEYNLMPIATYIVNLKTRSDRKKHILNEFAGRDEFTINIIEACQHENGAVGFWSSIKYILQHLVQDDEFILLCEDDHQFTENYSREYLFACIREAQDKEADILSGGVSWFKDAMQISDDLFWVERFSGMQFTVIFKRFYSAVLGASFGIGDNADYKISELSANKLVMYPFISTQKEFGYSDVTSNNNKEGRVEELFRDCAERIRHLKNVNTFYKNSQAEIDKTSDEDDQYEGKIPVYIINLPERTDRLEHIKKQFWHKPEFDVTIVAACRHEIEAIGLWETIRQIMQRAITNDDDVIILCGDDHEFTESYSAEYLFRNIIEAHQQGIDYLSGGPCAIEHPIPVTESRYWVSSCWGIQFIILYKKFFQQILDEPFTDESIPEVLLSDMTANKMILHPNISVKKDFGCLAITPAPGKPTRSTQMTETSERLERVKQTFIKYRETVLS